MMALITLLEKKGILSRAEILEEIMNMRKNNRKVGAKWIKSFMR